MFNRKMKPVAAAIGTAFVASLATASVANADEALFQAEELDQGYDLLAGAEGEAKCGEGQCGEGDEGKCGEGQCGEGDEGKCGEGQCGEGDEGKCGEGQCGGAE